MADDHGEHVAQVSLGTDAFKLCGPTHAKAFREELAIFLENSLALIDKTGWE